VAAQDKITSPDSGLEVYALKPPEGGGPAARYFYVNPSVIYRNSIHRV
jgi:hypothetical protein